jgi:hypothetical protein
MKKPIVLLALGALTLVAAPGTTGSQDPPTKRACNTINLGGPKVFYKHKMRCHKAKHYARRLYKTNGRDEPRTFDCYSGSHFNNDAYCRHRRGAKYFGWHPADKRRADTLDS